MTGLVNARISATAAPAAARRGRGDPPAVVAALVAELGLGRRS